jgi:hypothetical protein
MDIRTMSWGTLTLMTLMYWFLLIGGWRIYVTRPSRRGKAWEQASKHIEEQEGGGVRIRVTYEVNLAPYLLVLLLPPLVLLAVKLLL